MRDVVIVGAGPVGSLLAILLAQRGVSVEVVEARATGSAHSRAIGIHPPAIEALARAGVADAALDRGIPITHGQVLCDGSVLGSLDFVEAGAAYPFVLSLPQRHTEGLLADRLEQVAPGAVRRGVRFTGMIDHGDRVTVDTDAGPITARYVVGADGARSTVRSVAGIGWTARGDRRHYVMADYDDDLAHPHRALLYFERGGVVESFPLPESRRRWVAMTDRDWSGAGSADLADLIGDRTGVRPPTGGGPVSAFSVRQHLAARMVLGHVVLVGDAAHEISPIGGQGMNLGWLDVLDLAPALEDALGAGGRNSAALAAFDTRRRRSARTASLQAAFNMGMGRPAAGVRLAARNAIVRSLAVPPTRAIAARAFTMRWL